MPDTGLTFEMLGRSGSPNGAISRWTRSWPS